MSVTRRRLAALAVASAALAACNPPAGDAAEVAAELRALRLALADRGGAHDPERAALHAAIAAAGKTQQDLVERQAALQAEVRNWSQLVAQESGSQRGAEAKALASRIAELDAELRQQQARQAELEAVLRQTLDRAAERIDALLQRREGASPPATAAGGAVAPVGGFAFDVRLVWAAVAAAGVVSASYVLRGRPHAVPTREATGGADEGVPAEAIAPFTALANEGVGMAAPAPAGAPGCERLAVAPERAAAAMAVVVADPLVLRRPAPLLASGVEGLAISYWLAPACSPAAHQRLRQRAMSAR